MSRRAAAVPCAFPSSGHTRRKRLAHLTSASTPDAAGRQDRPVPLVLWRTGKRHQFLTLSWSTREDSHSTGLKEMPELAVTTSFFLPF